MRPTLALFLLLPLAACNRREPTSSETPDKTSAAVTGTAATTPALAKSDNATPATNAAAVNPPNAESSVTAKPTTAAATAAPAPDGEQLFLKNCATCHMANGSGVPFLQPAIRGSAWLSNDDPQPLLSLILRGSVALGETAAGAYENDMAPFSHLSDAEIAALATHARNRFATPPPAKPVTVGDVATARSRPGMPWAGK